MAGHERGCGSAILDAQFHEGVLQMLVDGPRAGTQDLADVPARLAPSHPQQHLGLALGQLVTLGEAGHRALHRLLHRQQELAAADAADAGERMGRGLRRPGQRDRGRACDDAAYPCERLALQHRPTFRGHAGGADEACGARRVPEHATLTIDRDQGPARGFQGGACAAHASGVGQVTADPGDQGLGVDRLGDVVDTAGVEALYHVLAVGETGHEQDRHRGQRGQGAQGGAGLETIQARHDGVEQDHVGCEALHPLDRGRTICCHQHGHAGRFERVGEQRQRLGGVIHDEHHVPPRWISRFAHASPPLSA